MTSRSARPLPRRVAVEGITATLLVRMMTQPSVSNRPIVRSSRLLHARRQFTRASLMLLLGAGVSSMRANDTPDTGTISGTVLTQDGATPLSNARVTLTPLGEADNGASERRDVEFRSRLSVTGADGSYEFADVPIGLYRLVIRHIGYRSVALEVHLKATSPIAVSAALELLPIYLEPVEVRTTAAAPYGRRNVGDDDYDGGRVNVERWRQRAFVTSDARTVTHQDVLQAITLGAPDVFRALQAVPGVGTRDDWTAEAWVRGAPWGQTRTYFDGLPLFNPLHAGGVTSAVNADAIGSVMFFPGVRSVALGEGAAGVVSITSRPAGGRGDLRGFGTLSLLGGGVTLEKRFAKGRVGTMVGARLSKFQFSASDLEPTESTIGELELPDDYTDLVGRVDVDLGKGWQVESSGLWERDRVHEALENGPTRNAFGWGNTAVRVTLDGTATPAIRTRHTIGFSRLDLDVRRTDTASNVDRFNDVGASPTQPASDGDVGYLTVSGEVGSVGFGDGDPGWRVGYQVARQWSRYRGAPVSPFPIQTVRGSAAMDQRLTVAGVWGETRWVPTTRLRVLGGLRVDGSGPIRSASKIRFAPQLSARYTLFDRLSLAAGAGRTYQYQQPLAPVGLTVGPGLPVGQVWLVAGRNTPALHTDMVTLGAESWFDAEWLASFTVFARRTAGVAIIDPTPGRITDRSTVVEGKDFARGVETSVRRLAGPWTFSIGYGYGVAETEAEGMRFPSTSDRRHTFDVSARWRALSSLFGGRLNLGGAYAASSGAPYTRVFPGLANCDRNADACVEVVPDLQGTPNGARAPWYSSFDVMVDWSRGFSRWRFGTFLQVLNVLNRDNAVTYTVRRSGPCTRTSLDAPLCSPSADRFFNGRPPKAAFGLRVQF